MLEVHNETRENAVVLRLKGQLDALTAGTMAPTVDELMAAQTKNIIFDLSEITLIDSSGIGAIVSVFKRTRSWGGDTRISGLSAQPFEVFKLLKLDKVIPLFDTLDAAVASFK